MKDPGELIRYWRKKNGLSQLDLSLAANISSKHVSFLENGRSQPSREMVILLSNTMNIPLSDRNILLSLSGFSEAYSRMTIDQPEMDSVQNALKTMVGNHSPYPAVVLDWNWDIIMSNESQQRLMKRIAQGNDNFPDTNNALELLFDPNGLRPFVENWEEVAFMMIQRIQRERMLHQDRRSDLLQALMKYPDVPSDWSKYKYEGRLEPMLNIVLLIDGVRLKLFSTLASFGTAIDVTMQELTIEQYFPADEATKEFFESDARKSEINKSGMHSSYQINNAQSLI